MNPVADDLFATEEPPARARPAPTSGRRPGKTTQAALVAEALKRSRESDPAPTDIGDADRPANCYEVTSPVGPRRMYLNPNTGQRYVGRALFP